MYRTDLAFLFPICSNSSRRVNAAARVARYCHRSYRHVFENVLITSRRRPIKARRCGGQLRDTMHPSGGRLGAHSYETMSHLEAKLHRLPGHLSS